MANYENMNASEVKRLAKQGDKDALFEMAWRFEFFPPGFKNGPVERCAWQDYWFEKAADVGNIDAKSRLARSLIDRQYDSEWRQKAIDYFAELVRDYYAGKLKGDLEIDGKVAILQLGMMLCQGFGTRRDAVLGVKLIKEADRLTNGFDKYGYPSLSKLAETYGQGCAQENGEPTVDDLRQAIAYQKKAIKAFDQQKNDPNNRGYLGHAKEYLDLLEGWKATKESLKDSMSAFGYGGSSNNTTVSQGFKEYRERMSTPSTDPVVRERIAADKAALEKLRRLLARDGW